MISALLAFPRAISIISTHRLWGYIVVPGLVSVLLGVAIFGTAWYVSDDIGAWLIRFYPWEWGRGWIATLVQALGGLFVLLIGLILFKHLVLALASPIMSFLSEKVENIILGRKVAGAFSASKAMSDTVRGLRLALRNIIREVFYTLLLFVAGVILPVLSPITSMLILLVQAYYAGFGNMDYTLERYFRVKGSVSFARRHKGVAIGNGLAFLFMLFTLVGFFFALPLSTVAATSETLKYLPASE